MFTYSLLFAAATALTLTTATPIDSTLLPPIPLTSRSGPGTFNLNIWNNCPWTKRIALYQITPSFAMVQRSNPINIPHGQRRVIAAPYHDLGMRLSGHAEWGTAAQWKPQALFEFGFSKYGGREGTAYDLSVMQGSDKDVGIGAYPIRNGRGSGKCPSKTCFPWHCPLGQGWTNPDQTKNGSPADTVCYAGKTDFKVVFCP